jgi:uncharacterized protein (TIGR03382 family)
MKKAIALIPFVAKKRRRNKAQTGAKFGGPALLALAGAAAAIIVRRRKRTDAGFDASPSELSDRQPGTSAGDESAPPTGQGRPSTLEGDPAESVPLAAAKGVGENAVAPDTGTDDPLVREAEQAAAAEAGSIGGDVPDTPPTNEPDFATDPATRPVEEGSGSAYESFSERES